MYQERLAEELREGRSPPTLLLLEHPHTFTFGRRGQIENLVWSKEELKARGVELHWIDRGGDVTYHGPGQLVGYPILPLGPISAQDNLPKSSYIEYIRSIEYTLIQALAKLGLASGQLQGLSGVWVQPEVASRCRHCPPAARSKPSKIAAIGVRVDRHGISRHGFALNVHPDMTYWNGIVACGLADYPAVSLAELVQPAPSFSAVEAAVIEAFGETFDYRMLEEAVRGPYPSSKFDGANDENHPVH